MSRGNKVNVYLDAELADMVRAAELPVSSICQEALRQAVAADQPCIRKGCKRKPGFQIMREGFVGYACAEDVADYLGDHADVRML